MKQGMKEKEAIQEACEVSNLLIGFTVTADHSLVLTERGYTNFYSKRKDDGTDTRNLSTLQTGTLR
jgi:hypothetical protein